MATTKVAVAGNGSGQTRKGQDTNGSRPIATKQETRKLTLHIPKPIIKEVKLRALKKDMTVSAFAANAFVSYLQVSDND